MANTGDNSTEIKEHTSTYGGFVQLMLWGTIICFALAAFVVLMIAG